MKLIGFVKEYHDIVEATELVALISSEFKPNNVDEIINYLNRGHLLLAWMGYFIDVKTKELIAPDSYYTDGFWVWPAYLPYYLSKYPNLKLEEEFINYLRDKNFNFQMNQSFESNKERYETELAKKLSGNGLG